MLLKLTLSSLLAAAVLFDQSLADQLFAAPDSGARAALLEREAALVTPALVSAMNELAGKAYDRRDYARALAMYQVACEVAPRAADRRGLAVCTYDQGLAELRLQRIDAARAHFETAIALYHEVNDPPGLLQVLNAMANLLRNTGDLHGSLPYYEQALSLSSGIGEVATAQTNTNFGTTLLRLGNYRQAIERLQSALAITRRRNMERETAMVLTNLGSAYFEQGDFELGRSHSEQALAIKEKLRDPGDIATALVNLGVIHHAAGENAAARARFDRALKLTDDPSLLPLRLTILADYGNLLFSLHDYAPAREMLERTVRLAEESGNTAEAAYPRVVLARIAVDQQRPADALPLAGAAIDYGRSSGEVETLVEALDVQAVALSGLHRFDEAQTALEQAIAELESMRAQLPGEQQSAVHFLDSRRSIFLHMIQLQLDRKQPEAALAYVERSKARSLLDRLKLGNPAITRSLTAEETGRERASVRNIEQLREAVLRQAHRPAPDRKRLEELGAQLAAARLEYRALEAQLYAAHPRLRVARAAFDPLTPADLLAAASGESTAMLDYSITEAGISLFVLTRAPGSAPDLRVYRIARPATTVERDIARFRQQIATRDLAWQDLARTLYRDLIQPAAGQIKPGATLVISPDGFLWNLPFQALVDSSTRAVVESHPLFYTPSLTVLAEMGKVRDAAASHERLLAVNALDLPSAAREVEGMRQVYGAPRTEVLSGLSADSASVRREASKFDVLHLAAHGVFDNRNPLNSYVLLARDEVMEARDWMDLNLHASMVVLSGCETARGSAAGGEGLLGMSWALFIAGSPATVASQWKVDAEATSQLMVALHRETHRSTRAAALRSAALEVRKNPAWRHPYYWSGFILIGDGL